MAPAVCAKFQYVVTSNGPKILPVEDACNKDEESPADYNAGGYLPVKVGDTFKNNRYCVVRKLGWGHFSTVWLVKDTHKHCHSALKVVKSAGRYAETARDEIKLLSQVASVSPGHPGRSHIVSFLDSFVNQGPESSHVCIVFEPLGENLLALIERNKKKGLPKALVKVIAKQILLGLQYLHDECDLVHTDIKPENILISIPEVEAHISNELSQSPTPTSRRVGVPLPTRSRAGVTIPRSQQRARRQVEIFDSQPLSSPDRSVDLTRSRPVSASASTSYGAGGSGSNSLPGSYLAQMHMSKLPATGSTPASATTKDLAAMGLNNSGAPVTNKLGPIVTKGSVTSNPSPSTSSSSLSSTTTSTHAGRSSITSTPPTSLSHSLGSVVAGFMAMSKISSFTGVDCVSEGTESHGILMKAHDENDRTTAENVVGGTASASWKDHIVSPSALPRKVSPPAPSSSKFPSSGHGKSKLSQVHSLYNSQHRVGLPSSSFWKDPGTGAPAPTVLVSAVAGADDGDDTGNFFDLAANISHVGRPTASESSSATATIARPSPIGTPTEPPLEEAKSYPTNDTKNLAAHTVKSPGNATEPNPILTQTAHRPNPSLLTQTAPSKAASRSSQSATSQASHLNPLTQDYTLCVPSNPMDRNPIPNTERNNSHIDSKRTFAHVDHTCPALLALNPSTPPPTPVDITFITSVEPPSALDMPSKAASVRSRTPAIQVPFSEPAPLPPPPPSISIKIADLGNATPSKKHYTEDIQTRQYRAPEAILGKRDWDARADIWSVACLVFELLTAEFLFDPHGQGELFTKDDDHMAQIIELLGDFPLEVKTGGKYSRELFDHLGNLRYIHSLKPWPLKRVMIEKYFYAESDAVALCNFLLPMLAVDMRERKHARDMLDHSWLRLTTDDELICEW